MINRFNIVSISIIEKDYNLIGKELSSLLEMINLGDEKFEFFESVINFKEIYIETPPRGGRHLPKFMVWEPMSLPGKSAFISNYEDGLYTLIYKFCKTYNHKAIMLFFFNSMIVSNYPDPAFKLNYLDFENGKKMERIIYCIKENGKWEFFEKGLLQKFEDPQNYKKKFKKDRFNKEIILEYLLKMDIDIEREDFWQSKTGKALYFQTMEW